MYLPLPGCVALCQNELWKNGADEAAADRSQGSHSAHHVSHVTCHFFILTEWISLLLEGLLSTGPTPSSLWTSPNNEHQCFAMSAKYTNIQCIFSIVYLVVQSAACPIESPVFRASYCCCWRRSAIKLTVKHFCIYSYELCCNALHCTVPYCTVLVL